MMRAKSSVIRRNLLSLKVRITYVIRNIFSTATYFYEKLVAILNNNDIENHSPYKLIFPYKFA